MRHRGRTADQVIGWLASRSHGVVTHAMLVSAGITLAEIRHRLASGGLIRVHPGVYRVGHSAPSVEATYLAAVWGCGAGALLYGEPTAFLLRLVPRRLSPPPEVIAPTERRVKGVRVHRSRCLLPEDAATYRGIPITTVPRTLVDLASTLSLTDLARACHEAGVKHRTTPRQVEAVLARRPNAKGAPKLKAVLRGDTRVTLSALEDRFVELLGKAGLPLPQTNRRAGTKRVDCRWPERRLTVELDSYTFHNSRHAWEQDRRREREARARGDEFRRYTYGDVFEEPELMVRELRDLLRCPA